MVIFALVILATEHRFGIVRRLQLQPIITEAAARGSSLTSVAGPPFPQARVWHAPAPPPPLVISIHMGLPPPPAVAVPSPARVTDASMPPKPSAHQSPPPLLQRGTSVGKCTEMSTNHGVVIGSSWGSLPLAMQLQWTRLGCDSILRHASAVVVASPPSHDSSRSPTGSFLGDYRRNHRDALAGRETSRRIQRNATVGYLPPQAWAAAGGLPTVIAVCACTTSRGFSPSRLEQLALFRLMVPSLVSTFSRSASRMRERLELWLYAVQHVAHAWPNRTQALALTGSPP